jgi:putative transcription factor
MSHQDHKPQVFNFGPRSGTGGGGSKKVSESQANRISQVGGQVEVTKKMGAGNKHFDLGRQAKHLDDDHDTMKVKTVDFNVRANIQRGRQAKNWTQKELATAINERPSLVSDYEQGKAVPNEAVLNRMEKALGIYLRGVKGGQPLAGKGPAPGPPGAAPAGPAGKK